MTIALSGEEFDVVVRGHRLHGQRFGSVAAPLVLALHGLSGNMRAFDFLGSRLGGDSVQLVALDLRGRGKSEATAAGTYGWESHALDLFAVADALSFERLSIVGLSMGGSVAMKAADLDGSRLDAIVLLDIAGRVDPGVGPVVESIVAAESYVEAVKAQDLIEAWSEHWDRFYQYPQANHDAVAEDRRYTATQDPHERWKHLTMPTLLLRAARELRPGAGHVVPVTERDRFLRAVPHAEAIDIDANHLTIATHPATPPAIATFLAAALAR